MFLHRGSGIDGGASSGSLPPLLVGPRAHLQDQLAAFQQLLMGKPRFTEWLAV